MAKTISDKKIFKDLMLAKKFIKQSSGNNIGFKNRLNKTIQEKYDQRKITYEQYQILKSWGVKKWKNQNSK